MRKVMILTALALAFVLASPAVFAAPGQDKKGDDVTVFDFEEDEVTVSFLKPEVGFVGLIQQEKAASLIKIRQDFVDEIVQSADDL